MKLQGITSQNTVTMLYTRELGPYSELLRSE